MNLTNVSLGSNPVMHSHLVYLYIYVIKTTKNNKGERK